MPERTKAKPRGKTPPRKRTAPKAQPIIEPQGDGPRFAIKDTLHRGLVAQSGETLTFDTAHEARVYRDTNLEDVPRRFIVVNHG